MLVFISDLHLTDGSSGQTIHADAFRILRKQLCDLAYAASWRGKDSYRPLEEMHLVLLGDILDVIRSSKWTAPGSTVRPWSDVNDPAFGAMVASITQGILTHNADPLAILRGIARCGDVYVPSEPAGYTPGWRTNRVVSDALVRVGIHYQVGNHDWFYHLPGPVHDQIRTAIVDAMGLAHDPLIPFPHDANESPNLQSLYKDHGVWARHGDVFDPFNFERTRDAASLGDAIVVELLNRFPQAVQDQLSGQVPQTCIDGLREVDNVRPLLLVPAWVEGLLQRTCPPPAHAAVKKVWDDLADQFLAVTFVKAHDSPWNPLDLVDRLRLVLKFSEGTSLKAMTWLTEWVRRWEGDGDAAFHQNALAEEAFTDGAARIIVYGHTHGHEIVPLDLVPAPAPGLGRFYINTGTWRRVYELARRDPEKHEFLGYDVMTYLMCYKGDERAGRPFETWSGALDSQ